MGCWDLFLNKRDVNLSGERGTLNNCANRQLLLLDSDGAPTTAVHFWSRRFRSWKSCQVNLTTVCTPLWVGFMGSLVTRLVLIARWPAFQLLSTPLMTVRLLSSPVTCLKCRLWAFIQVVSFSPHINPVYRQPYFYLRAQENPSMSSFAQAVLAEPRKYPVFWVQAVLCLE